jgi:hypothetical protein
LRRSTARGRLTVDANGWTLDPDWVRLRLGRLLWHYTGTASCVSFDAAFPFMYKDPHAALEDLYDRVTAIVRYLRQSVDWTWELTHEEAQLWETSLAKIIRSENGVGDAPTTAVPQASPWGFNDFDAGG